MSSDQFDKAKELFLSSLQQPEEGRTRFLESQCVGNPELLQEVESLLAFHPSSEPPNDRSTREAPEEAFAGRYQILDELGRGGMGRVHRARDLVLGETVAIKLLPDLEPLSVESLLNEVRTARRVTHPNVCRVYDFGEWHGERFLTMELITGETLARRLRRGPLPREEAIDIAYQVCLGLDAVHRQGVLHRDLKPANVMIDETGRVKLMDFGIAGRVGEVGQAIGTPAYMSPEQRHRREASVESDLYSLGLLIHEMITGKSLLTGETASHPEKALEVFEGLPTEHTGLLGADLTALIRRCLAVAPSDRPSSVSQVLAELPAGDRLEALVRAGLTPAPEDVMAAGRQRGRSLHVSIGWPVLLLGLLLGLAILSDRTLAARNAWADQPPAVLLDKARSFLKAVGHGAASLDSQEPLDSAWGFNEGAGYYDDGLFWFRQSDEELVPSAIDLVLYESRPTYDDPPQTLPGMARLEWASDGKLASLEVEPVEESIREPLSVDRFLELAGYASSRLETTAPRDVPPMFADQRFAWRLFGDSEPRHVEAAFHQGRPVFFTNLPDDDSPADFEVFEERVALVSMTLWHLLWLGLALGGLLWAQHNRAFGRGDREGAGRLALLVGVSGLLAWALGSRHFLDLDTEAIRLLAALGWVLLQAAVAWLVYVALEPFVRRTWPQSLLSWSLLLRGSLRSPLVGRDLLVGGLVGTSWAILTRLDALLVPRLGLEPLIDVLSVWQLEVAGALRWTAANALLSFWDAIQQGLLALFYLAALKRWMPRPWLVVPLFVLMVGGLSTMDGAHPAVSWLTLGLGISLLTLALLVRLGVLALITSHTVFYFLETSPLTVDKSAWFAELGTLAAALVFAVAAYGFWVARGRRVSDPTAARSS